MKCPACNTSLAVIKLQGVSLDVCRGGCGGIWFDNFELKKFEVPRPSTAELLNIPTNPAIQVDPAKKRNCPRCENVPMMRHYYSITRQVQVDHCPSCGGYWLDAGELAAIQGEYKSGVGKTHPTRAFVSGAVAAKPGQVPVPSPATNDRTREIGNIISFINPIE